MSFRGRAGVRLRKRATLSGSPTADGVAGSPNRSQSSLTPTSVVHVITRLIVGGAQENTILTCARTDHRRFASRLVVGPETGSEGSLFRYAEELRVPVTVLPSLVRRVAPKHDAMALLSLYRLFRRERPGIVHTHSSKAGLLGRLAAWLARVPVVIHTVHGWSFHDHMPTAVRRTYVLAERAAARITDRLIVVADKDRDVGLAETIGRADQYVTIRSGVDLAPFFEAAGRPTARIDARERLGVPSDGFVIGSVLRLSDQKNPLAFVRAARLVLDARPDAWFVMVGDGSLRPEVESLAADVGLAERLRLPGVRRDVAELLPAFDVFLLPSLWEGLPRVIPQALAAGIPVVASRVAGIEEIVHTGLTGELVENGTPAEFADAVLKLGADPSLVAEYRARAHDAVGEFELHRMLDGLNAVYSELDPNS